ncbi:MULTISPECIES: universal stress protein [Dehalococcoides]|jgi:nucleotide-binding universal stress UspA family protein|uniref:Universal stress protein family n=1 Tax=Dehalococcoides mccartyi (strain VS) TaxID=311424 RepID=D2BIQ0_DEHMV|nr:MULTISPECIES: universal stress protein [Dehalococcoides]ACZ62200.1 universal stress protein family [Dehalococcoides mccartyi VS]AHB13905.1 universal stress protein [Dehalococcoides mccartyi GY50]AII58255.1 universal stress protein [Dehalococcoides mccartyi CG1]APH12835.1 universal stress protein [Dehalococcoides mccartyi]QYY57743.1 universal stress protein [Dehalococcoides mccartyi]
MYKKILVPLDGSKVAEGVLPHAKALAFSEGSQILLLNVVSNPAVEFAFSDPAIAAVSVNEQVDTGKEYMAGVENKLKGEGYDVRVLLREGGAAEVILNVAEKEKVDVIAMSTHGRSGAARWLLGSVAERVVRHSHIPIMLIRSEE